jgi:heme/copper-type cytochrome/quinol oxidase subunit 3
MAAPVLSVSTAPPPPPLRPRTLLVGSALVASMLGFAITTMVGIYLARRSDVLNTGRTWLPEGSRIPLPQPNMMFVTLLMSCVTVAWAAYALRRNDRQNAYVALGITTLMAFAYVVQATYLFSISNIPVDAPEGQGVLFWAISGSHLAMVFGGFVFMALMTFRALSGSFRRIPDGVTAVAIYWSITTGVYGIIWYAVYVTK